MFDIKKILGKHKGKNSLGDISVTKLFGKNTLSNVVGNITAKPKNNPAKNRSFGLKPSKKYKPKIKNN